VSALFPAAPQRSSEAAEPQADNVNFRDLANFDLDFHLSDSDLGHFDVSADFLPDPSARLFLNVYHRGRGPGKPPPRNKIVSSILQIS